MKIRLLILGILVSVLFCQPTGDHYRVNFAGGYLYDYSFFEDVSFETGFPEDIAVIGDYMFIAQDSDLGIFDNSDPTAPLKIASIDDPSNIKHVAVLDDSHIIVASAFDTMLIVDVSVPFDPVVLSTLEVAHRIYDMAIAGDYCYVVTESGIRVICVSDPLYPVVEVSIPGDWGCLAIDGTDLYTIEADVQADKWDISVPTDPVLVSSVAYTGIGLEMKLDARGDRLYVIPDAVMPTDHFFDVIDFTDPIDPMVSEIPLHVMGNGQQKGISVTDDYIFILENGTGDMNSILFVLDRLDPEYAVQGSLVVSDMTKSVCLNEHYLFAGIVLQRGYIVVDVACFTDRLKDGWNLVSYPYEGSTFLTFASVLSPAFSYDPVSRSYIEEDTLIAGKGYWISAPSDGQMCFADATEVSSVEVTLLPGWNLIGGPVQPVSASIFEDYPEVVLPIYGYNNAVANYEARDALMPFYAYWVLAEDTVVVTLE